MGLFSRETTVYVSTVIYPLGEDPEKIPDLLKAAVITAGMRGASRSRAIDTAIFDGDGVKLHQAFQYAKRSYYGGLPTGYPTIGAAKDDRALELLCEEYLAGLHGVGVADVLTVAVEYGNNYETILRQQIETKYKYDFFEEEVHTSVFGIPVLSTLSYEVLEPDDLLHADELGWRLTFTKPDTTTVSFDEWYAESLFVGQDTRQNRIIMEVSLSGAPAVTKSYTEGGSDARLNIFLASQNAPVSGTFPAIVLKKPKQLYLDTNAFTGATGTDAWKLTPAWKTSKTYAKRMGLDLADIINTVRDNADQKQIDYAFIQPGTLINSPTTAAHEYHFNYFNRLRTTMPDNKPAYDAWIAANGGTTTKKNKAKNCPSQSIRILDPDNTKGSVNMEIAWRYINYEVKTGTLAKPYTIECGAKESIYTNFLDGKGSKNVRYDVTKLYIRKRLTDNTYGELCICGLWHQNYVYKNETVQSGVHEAFNNKEDDFGTGFIIPLEYEVFITLSGRERLQLSQEALHMVFNCYKVVKQKWYETGIFKIVMVIIAAVVIYFSAGTLTGFVTSLYGSVAATVGSVMFVNVAVLTITQLAIIAAVSALITATILAAMYMGISYAAREAGEYAAERWGPAWGAVASIVVTMALTWGIAQGVSGFTGVAPPPTPVSLTQQVLHAASFVLGGLSTYTGLAMEQLKEQTSEWNDYITSPNNPQAELEKLMKEYFPDMTEIQEAAFFAPRESMDVFLGRTLSLVDGLTYRLTMPITNLSELTLTPKLD